MAAHKHAGLMLMFAKDATETDKPHLLWEYKSPGCEWEQCGCTPGWWPTMEYRRKPEESETYHYLFGDGSMSSGMCSLKKIQERFRGSARQGKYLVKLTRLDGVPARIEVVEGE